MTKSKWMGGVLLIVGTSIGGGMLALPVSMAAVGMIHSIFFLILCWLIMTIGALLILEVNLSLPRGNNMISMAKATLGLPGQIVAWITYLFLLYTLLAAYISGGSDVFSALLQKISLTTPQWFTSVLFTALFSMVIYKGIRTVDYVNRWLMFGKLGVYALLVLIISPHIQGHHFNVGSIQSITGSLMVLITSFGFASIVPSLRDYFEDDIHALRRIILIGSLIPLCCYIIWIIVIMGVIPRQGNNGLLVLMTSDHPTSGLTEALNHAIHNPWITGFFSFFTSICMITAFLGVSLGLFDFLADGLKLNKKGRQGQYTLALTFIPPVLLVLINPGIYLQALSYAGFCCVILLLLLPTLMAWRNRQRMEKEKRDAIVLPGGTWSLLLLGGTALFLLRLAI